MNYLYRPRTLAIDYDSAFRWLVPSNRNPEDKHLVELDAYKGNGRCVCEHFTIRCEPLIKIGCTPVQSIDQASVDKICIARGHKILKAIKLKVNRHVEDALRCEHILTARSQFMDDLLARVLETRSENEQRAQRHAV